MFTVEHERMSFITLKNLMSKSDVLVGHFGAEHFRAEHAGAEHFGAEHFGAEHFGAEHFGALKSMEYS
jgi:hypothetical protein